MLSLTLLAGVGVQSASAEYLNLTGGGSGSFGDGYFTTNIAQPTGTGVITPFLRIQQNGTEDGFNTAFGNGKPLDVKDSEAILVSSFGVVTAPNGVQSIRFLLDINESNGRNDELLSLDDLQVFVSTNSSIPTLGDLQTQATKVYDIDAAGGCSATSPALCESLTPPPSNGIKLNYELNPGSGAGDMYFYLPASLFSAYQNGYYLYLYSQFGVLGGIYASSGLESDAGFEEWARVDSASPIPEPTTYAFLLSLLSSAAVLYKKRRSAQSE